ncbi:MAG TPA: hypothetical protein P5250_03975 [Bacteroidales bacterium]|nr:hypothetical protein [Bacteroidales bacterium]
MLTKFYKLNFTSQILIILITGIILWLPSFVNPFQITYSSTLTPLFNKLINILNIWKYLPILSGLICLYLIVFILNDTLANNEIISKNNYAPALLAIILSSWHPVLLNFQPILPGSLFLILAMRNALKSATQDEPINNPFYTGFYIALSSMFYFPFILLFLLIPIGFIVSRVFSWRSWLLSLWGALLPYILLLTWKFWNNKLFETIHNYINYFKNIPSYLNLNKALLLKQSIIINSLYAILLIIIILALMKNIYNLIEKNIAVRRSLIWIIWCLIIVVAASFFNKERLIYSQIIMLFSSIIIEQFIYSIKKNIYVNLIFIILISFIIFFRFYN